MDFFAALRKGQLLILDGAMGTMLQASGMPTGVTPERFCFENPRIVQGIHERYIAAGSSVITTATFGGNPFKLDPSLDVTAYNRAMAAVARAAADGSDHPVYVAGNLGPSGQFIQPLGSISPSELIDGYRAQVRALLGSVDLFLLETQFDLAEARALVVAVRMETKDVPIVVSMTFEGGLSLTGSTPEIFVETMQNMAVQAIGTNCSLGPDQMVDVLRRMRSCAQVPLFAEPNAGLPELRDGQTVFPLDAERFAEKTAPFVDMGVQILGGCCGTTPAYIEALVARTRDARVSPPQGAHCAHGATGYICLTSRSRLVRIGEDAPFCLIGERINPTGKKKLTRELQEHSFETALAYAATEIDQGASVLDVNVGAPLVDESRILPELTRLLVHRFDVPLSLDSSSTDALTQALPWFPGSALVNSITGEGDRLEELAPQCALYGAPFILLPLKGKDLPVTASARQAILESLLDRLDALGIPRRLVLVDILALTVSAKSESAVESLRLLRFCSQNGLPTTIGLSNISFGLPARELLNASFLCMAAGAGLNSCIANPGGTRIQEALAAVRVLKNHDPNATAFIARYANWTPTAEGAFAKTSEHHVKTLFDAVVLGDSDHVLSFVDAELAKGKEPFALVQDILLPAMTAVGEKYEQKEFFLPQLLRAAETMQRAFAYVKPMLEKTNGAAARPVIVLATVEGDIHDIGKNIVALLLANHGFEVIDCGKDVPASKIVACAEEQHAQLIGLSALMTTTMVKMEETIQLLAERKSPIKVMIGGAAVTQRFADAIGADAYCPDAVSAVREAKRLLDLA